MRAAGLGFALALCALRFSADVGAQTIYRCGNEYTRVPCSNGRALDAIESRRTGAQRAEAERNVAAEKRLAAEMERDRRRDEAALRPALAGSLSAVRAAAPAASAPKKAAPKKRRYHSPRADANTDFVAGVPASGKKNRSAAR